jgi:cell division septation protein DedD
LLSAAPPTEEPAPAATAAAEDGWIVQVSSQRTREEAESSWNAMRERYASVLGSLQPSIQQADLGEKGVFHRVRVGPWPTREKAIEVCEALKAAGGSCFVAQ